MHSGDWASPHQLLTLKVNSVIENGEEKKEEKEEILDLFSIVLLLLKSLGALKNQLNQVRLGLLKNHKCCLSMSIYTFRGDCLKENKGTKANFALL